MGEFSVSKPLQEVSVFLDNHWNRDQVFRTLQYASTLCAGALEGRLPSLSVKFAAVASSVSGVRITLRLLDDLPNLAHTLDSWRRPKDSSFVPVVELISSLSGLLYYPTEHLAWATDLNLLPFKSSTKFWKFCTLLWITSLITSCLRSIATLWQTRQEMRLLRERPLQLSQSDTAEGESPGQQSGGHGNGRKRVTFQDQTGPVAGNSRMGVLQGRYARAALSLLQSLSDLMNAVHFLPGGVLWGGRFPALLVGLFGTISSLLGLYKTLPHRSRHK